MNLIYLMTTNQLQQIIDYIKETEEALVNWDMDSLAMTTELPILIQNFALKTNKFWFPACHFFAPYQGFNSIYI